jgi:hypothetical protein
VTCSLGGEQEPGDEPPEHVVLHATADLDVDGTLDPEMAAEFRDYLVVQTPETLQRFQETVAPGVALADQTARLAGVPSRAPTPSCGAAPTGPPWWPGPRRPSTAPQHDGTKPPQMYR